MSKYKRLQPEELEVGMTVAYPIGPRVGGWRYGGYGRLVWGTCKVRHVTPRRTKAVLEYADGNTRDVSLEKYAVYALDDDMAREPEMAKMYRECVRLFNHERMKMDYRPLDDISDSELVRVHELLTELDSIMTRKERG